MKIAILDDYQDAVRKLDCFALLQNAQPAHDIKIFNNTVKGIGQLAARLSDVEALVLIRERTHISRALLERLPRLRVISQTGSVSTGTLSHIDLHACHDKGVTVLAGQGDPTAPAELTWALIMAAQRRLPQYIGNLKHGAWQQSGMKSAVMPANFGLGTVLKGQTLGLWGFGRIGRLVAGYGRAFGMHVQVWGSETSRARAIAEGFVASPDKETFLETSDVLSLHLRLSEKNQASITLTDLSRMKPTALFVNTSRAELLEENVLISALNRGRPGLAAVDVFESEPILQGHTLLRMENCICSPHIGYVERDNYERYFQQAFRNLLDHLAGHNQAAITAPIYSEDSI
jgi:D-3-phosphoglycerate dehydrogenase / 2-oxoglutarate reductase